MKPLDRKMQRQVWERVYDQRSVSLTSQQRQALQRCLQRSRENLAFYEKMENHNTYAAAFDRLATETREHIKMQQQMLR